MPTDDNGLPPADPQESAGRAGDGQTAPTTGPEIPAGTTAAEAPTATPAGTAQARETGLYWRLALGLIAIDQITNGSSNDQVMIEKGKHSTLATINR